MPSRLGQLPWCRCQQVTPGPCTERAPWVLSVGEIKPHKGFDFLIRALANLPATQRPPLRLIGNAADPGHRAALESLARRLEVELHIEIESAGLGPGSELPPGPRYSSTLHTRNPSGSPHSRLWLAARPWSPCKKVA